MAPPYPGELASNRLGPTAILTFSDEDVSSTSDD
jgi:hypothetical protein